MTIEINSYLPGWHQVIAVEYADERLEFGSLFDLLLAHTFGDFAWVAIDSGDQAV